MRAHGRLAVLGAVAVATGSLLATAPGAASGAASARGGAPASGRPRVLAPGTWVRVDAGLAGQNYTATPTLWMNPNGDATLVWYRSPTANKFTYEAVVIGPNGTIVEKPVSVFGSTYWNSLSDEPTLVPDSGGAALIFDGVRTSSGIYSAPCVYGDLGTSSGWTLQSWTLSNDCFNPIGGATATKGGVLSAAWPGGWSNGHGVLYRVGTQHYPIKTADQHIALNASAARAGEAADTAGNDHIWVAWTQTNSSPRSADGYYVKDVTAATPSVKVPGTGTLSANYLGGDLVIASTNTHGGIFVAFAANTSSSPGFEIWKVGWSKPLAVPDSANTEPIAIGAGPKGRLWVAWYLPHVSPNEVDVARTNRTDTRFGPVKTYKTPCGQPSGIGITSSTLNWAVIGLECLDTKLHLHEYATRVYAPLSFSPTRPVIKNTTSNKVTFTVRDAGDPVDGATVAVDGKSAKTGSTGTATISFAKGTKTGSYTITVSHSGYDPAKGTLVVKS